MFFNKTSEVNVLPHSFAREKFLSFSRFVTAIHDLGKNYCITKVIQEHTFTQKIILHLLPGDWCHIICFERNLLGQLPESGS